jgi:hypothetical protein
VLFDRVAGGLDDAWVAGQAQVVVRPEHDHALAVDDGLGALVGVEGLEERVEAEGLGLLYQLERARFREYVAAVGVVIATDVQGIDVDGGRERFFGEGLGFGSQRAFLSGPRSL